MRCRSADLKCRAEDFERQLDDDQSGGYEGVYIPWYWALRLMEKACIGPRTTMPAYEQITAAKLEFQYTARQAR